MFEFLISLLTTLNDLLTAGIAITAFSLLLYALTFNLRDRVARSFAIIMVCMVIIFVGQALERVTEGAGPLTFWLRLQWLGIAFLPASYLHLSDAILATTGRPSRGRRRMGVRLAYLVSFLFAISIPFNGLVGELVQSENHLPRLQSTLWTWIFAAGYLAAMVVTWVNFWRAYKRTTARASQRRMTYLIAGALIPALGSYPYLLLSAGFASQASLLFQILAVLNYITVSALLVLMAYSVAFFGVSWPDRVVKRRMVKWILRGPVTASSVLAITTVLRRAGGTLNVDVSALVPVVMVASILILEHLITLFVPYVERWLFGRDREDMDLLQTLEERLLTIGDLRQFLEAILAAVSDRLQAKRVFIASLNAQTIELFVTIGSDADFTEDELSANLLEIARQNGLKQEMFTCGDYWLVPLFDDDNENALIGLMGATRSIETPLDTEQTEALEILSRRAALALSDRHKQQNLFSNLEALTPQMDMIQRLRAASRYDGSGILTTPLPELGEDDLSQWVREALTHYWGGPKLTESPLIKLRIVQGFIETSQESPTNALRAILRQAIEKTRPYGERRFTAEWIIYNILEMKFMEGRKVREVAMRLAMSEADLYRKQRVAIEAVAQAIAAMEKDARHRSG